MLAGLLFAIADADDSPETLVATLPFGGHSLIEFQARLLAGAGAGQIVVVVERLTPELLGAVNRMARHGIAIDAVRGASEAVAKLHPLAELLVMADGLVTTAETIAPLAAAQGDALLVTSDADALPGLERVGRDAIWAGMARVSVRRLADVARLPADYDFQSTLLRVAAQARPELITLPGGAARASHGIEASAAPLQARNQAVVGAELGGRVTWADRLVIAPLARALLPLVLPRAVMSATVAGASAVLTLIGLALLAMGWASAGVALVALAHIGWALGGALAWLRDELRLAGAVRLGAVIASGAGAVLLGLNLWRADATASGPIAAAALIGLGALLERAAPPERRRRWWPSPSAYPLVLLPFVAAGQALAGLLAAAVYAGAALAAAIEAGREKA
ncbi:MAG: hypothetical protein A4S16_06120 [Proteobacteria bacterium SG_bin6]|nr:MAG: hypothetical protein A4S16_06120 [Proteobacteria bacterium SG_bin6]